MIVPQQLKLNTPLVVSQEIEGETILINFDSGCYYSTNATGSMILGLLATGMTTDELVATVAAEWTGQGTATADEVTRFLAEGMAEALLVEGAPDPVAAPPAVPSAVPLAPPRLERFDDLQDLLMLDPIHDVDAAGWPVPPPTPEAAPGRG